MIIFGSKGRITRAKADEVLKKALKGIKIEREEEDPRGYEMCKKLAENKISKEDIVTRRSFYTKGDPPPPWVPGLRELIMEMEVGVNMAKYQLPAGVAAV